MAESQNGARIALIYGEAGLGKTSLANTAGAGDYFAAHIDYDGGQARASHRYLCPALEDQPEADVLVVDSVSRLLDYLASEIIASRASALVQRDGTLSLKGYGALKAKFEARLMDWRAGRKWLVFIGHSKEVQGEGDRTFKRLAGSGSAPEYIMQSADVVGYLYSDMGRRVLNFNGGDYFFAKNPHFFAGDKPLILPPAEKLIDENGNGYLYRMLRAFEKKVAESDAQADAGAIAAQNIISALRSKDLARINACEELLENLPEGAYRNALAAKIALAKKGGENV